MHCLSADFDYIKYARHNLRYHEVSNFVITYFQI